MRCLSIRSIYRATETSQPEASVNAFGALYRENPRGFMLGVSNISRGVRSAYVLLLDKQKLVIKLSPQQ